MIALSDSGNAHCNPIAYVHSPMCVIILHAISPGGITFPTTPEEI